MCTWTCVSKMWRQRNAMNKIIPQTRPKTETEIQAVQRRAYDFAKKGDYESALALCDWLIDSASTRVAGLRQRSAVREHQGEIERAIEDREAVVSTGVDEPADMHALGLLYLQVDRDREANQVLAKGIEVCLREQAHYYLDSCRLLRAEALLRLGDREVALTELKELPAGYTAYVFGRGQRTREAMIEEAGRG